MSHGPPSHAISKCISNGRLPLLTHVNIHIHTHVAQASNHTLASVMKFIKGRYLCRGRGSHPSGYTPRSPAPFSTHPPIHPHIRYMQRSQAQPSLLTDYCLIPKGLPYSLGSSACRLSQLDGLDHQCEVLIPSTSHLPMSHWH